ncbi:MAG: hypothetical protein SFU25_03655 [Candidatus Caenarcaniphilales bacterium]|nr:hypothetical protein [Candidatus Caenarcaniphilales bacterium]
MNYSDPNLNNLEKQLHEFYAQESSGGDIYGVSPSQSWKASLMAEIQTMPTPNVIYTNKFIWNFAYTACLLCLIGLAFMLIYNPYSDYANSVSDLLLAQIVDGDGLSMYQNISLPLEELVL